MPSMPRRRLAKHWFTENWFPLEIWEYIISFVSDDVASLKAVAIVCSSFRPAAQLHLFSHVGLVEDRPSRVARPRYGRLYTCTELSKLFTECPHLVSHIRSLTFDDALLQNADPLTLGNIFAQLNVLDEAAVFFPPYTQPIGDTVQGRLYGYQRHQPYSRKCFMELFCLPTLTSLDLCASLFSSSFQLNSLLHQCPLLEHFAWHQTTIFEWNRTPHRPDLTPPKLVSLHIYGVADAFIPFIQRRAPFNLSHLRELSVGVMQDVGATRTALGALFHIVGLSLLEFRIEIQSDTWRYYSGPDGVFPLDFTELTSLRFFHLQDPSINRHYHHSWMQGVPIPRSLRVLKLEFGCLHDREGDRILASISLIAMGEYIASRAEHLEDVTLIAHRMHSRCAGSAGCHGYRFKTASEMQEDEKDKGVEKAVAKVKTEEDTFPPDDLLDQIIIRLPAEIGHKLHVMERTVFPPPGGKRWTEFDRFLVYPAHSRR